MAQSCSTRSFIYLAIITLIVVLFYVLTGTKVNKPENVDISKVVTEVQTGSIEKITVTGNKLAVRLKDGTEQVAFKEDGVSLTDYNIDPKNVNVEIKDTQKSGIWISILSALLPVLLIGGFIFLMIRQAQAGNNRALSFGKSSARLFSGGKTKVDFKDIAGLKESKEELVEVVDFLKNPAKFKKLGAEIPKGVLLLGPPGCGKTLLAKAVAGEANVPFFSISGSEFVEMFVGVGASRVRDLFQKAKRNAPAIIFIDEIDAVGRQRGSGLGGSHDEREQTLNQILVEMDGFETDTHVIVVAATNRPDVLDPALLRPGRFDRRITIDLPDKDERKEILKIHAKEKPLDSSVSLEKIAAQTAGFSGADLRNLMNEAAILAARLNKKTITDGEASEAIEKVMLGPERKSRKLSEKEKKIIAFHEGGHAVVAQLLPHADPVHKVSIISRGVALGYTWNLPLEDKHIHSKKEFEDTLASILGGRAAERIVFHELSTGAENDLRKATKMAKKMVTEFGMSEELGPVTWGEKEELVFLGKELAEHKTYSEKIAAKIDLAVTRIILEAENNAIAVLEKHKDKLDKLANTLLSEETISEEELKKIIPPVKRSE
jgi:cell division protease FtsH